MHPPDNQVSNFAIYSVLGRPSGLQYSIALFIRRYSSRHDPLKSIQFRAFPPTRKCTQDPAAKRTAVGGFATSSHYISLGDIIPENVDISCLKCRAYRFSTEIGGINVEHFHTPSNKNAKIISLTLQAFLLIPFRQYSIATLQSLISLSALSSVFSLFIIPISQSARPALTFILSSFLLIPVCMQVSAVHSRLSTCRYFDKNQRHRVT